MTTKVTNIPGIVLVGRKFEVRGTTDAYYVCLMPKDADEDELWSIGGGCGSGSGGSFSFDCMIAESGYPHRMQLMESLPNQAATVVKNYDIYAIGHFELIVAVAAIGIYLQKKYTVWK